MITILSKSWPQVLARRVGNTCTNYTKHGRTAKAFATETDEYALQQALSDTPKEMYLLKFGGNDANRFNDSYQLGSIEDITDYESYTDYPPTFYGYYGKIIEQLMNHAPKACFIMATHSSNWYSTNQTAVDNAVIEIANHYGIPYIVWADDYLSKSALFTDNMVISHPTPAVYAGMAMAFERMFGKCVKQFISYFNTHYYDPDTN
jgi:hypothetical protein